MRGTIILNIVCIAVFIFGMIALIRAKRKNNAQTVRYVDEINPGAGYRDPATRQVPVYEPVKPSKTKEWFSKMKWDYTIGETIFGFLGWAGLACVVFGLAGMLFKTVTTSGKADYCYLENYTVGTESHPAPAVQPQTLPPGPQQRFKLMASVAWRSDRQLGVFNTLEDAKKAAVELDCPLEPR